MGIDTTELYHFVFDVDYIKETHPFIYEKHAFTFLFLEEKNEWKVEECLQLIGRGGTLSLLEDVMGAEKEKNKCTD